MSSVDEHDRLSGNEIVDGNSANDSRLWGTASLFVMFGFMMSHLLLYDVSLFFPLKRMPNALRMAFMAFLPAICIVLGIVAATVIHRRKNFFSDVCGFCGWRFFYPFEGAAVELALFIPFTFLGLLSFVSVRLLHPYVPKFLSWFFHPEPLLKTVIINTDWGGFAVVAVVAVVVAPVVEEVAFRRIIYSFFRSFCSPLISVVAGSIIFAGVHMSATTFPVLFCLGVVAQLLANHHKSLYPAVFYHAAHNGLAMALLAMIKIFGKDFFSL